MAYILEHFFIAGLPILIPAIGLLFILFFNANSSPRIVKYTKITLFCIIGLLLIETIEKYFATLPEPTYWRRLFSFFGYILRPVMPCLVLAVFVPDRKKNFIIWIPILINFLVYQFSLYTDWIFWFDEVNDFKSNFINLTQPIICILYGVALLVVSLIKFNTKHIKEGIVIVFSICVCALAGFLEMIQTELPEDIKVEGFLNIGYVAALYMYFLFIHLNSSKRDTLTGLFNRETYYNDTEKYKSRLSSIIALDMNGLKQINDSNGHEAGDIGLMTIAKTIDMCCNNNMFGYRIGGDEFIILCLSTSQDMVEDVIEQFKAEILKAGYSCSIGYAYAFPDTSIDEMKKLADIALYNDKNKYYESLRK